ncbi:MAG TPA: DMT family transporter [Chitinophagales bacterium]|nr:DMT family transporter [Chitinophagales bacterium]HNA38683.1 DMT family transporter [Chitinophagales bacterium]HNC71864.1 DMT family transporter [Chitinophagales bacterium]HND82875.1 DMT family transporter [Chitinophagales bacterium]HNF18895.1 DMT family transporter [Chitinophagales bacterium]
MQLRSKAYTQMHIATFLWGLTAILGKLISIGEFSLVWYRVLFVSIAMLFIPKIIKHVRQLDKKTVLQISGIGILLSIHWVAWYASIKYANASVAVSCIACVSLFTAILEPIFTKTPFKTSNLLLSIFVIPGILLINQSLDFHYRFGFFLGIVAAFIAAIFGILNKKYTQDVQANVITFIQMLSGFIFLTLLMPLYLYFSKNEFPIPHQTDVFLLLVLALFCTVIPYNLFLKTLKITDAFTTSLINNLEPVYGIILAIIFLGENKELNWQFYCGTLIILFAVFLHAFLTQIKNRKM